MNNNKITHMVMFNLKHEKDSEKYISFLRDGKEILSKIPGVNNFEISTQISSKNNFSLIFSMQFDDQASYDRYSAHPAHVDFVNKRWLAEVSDFMEIDLVGLL